MNIRRFVIATAVFTAAPIGTFQAAAASPGIGHTFFMRGSVVEMTNGHIVICIGRVDGAAAGQVLKVYRNVTTPGPRSVGFRREDIGTVRIDSVLNDHYANASPVTGSVKVNDIVELERSFR